MKKIQITTQDRAMIPRMMIQFQKEALGSSAVIIILSYLEMNHSIPFGNSRIKKIILGDVETFLLMKIQLLFPWAIR